MGTSEESDLADIWEAAKAAFSGELEPHFSVEERLLLRPLASVGETALVERTIREHTRLRALIELDGESEVVLEFGELLTAHVRFEERELFPRAEEVLDAETLDAVATASAALEPAQERARRRL
ncbi:MAG: hemerythrin-like domain-containing protein [Bradymonadia bacterium]|jgi:hemerythrin-like domain-containing protein